MRSFATTTRTLTPTSLPALCTLVRSAYSFLGNSELTSQSRKAASKRESHCAYTSLPRSVSDNNGMADAWATNPIKYNKAYRQR